MQNGAPEYRPLHIQIRDLLRQRIANQEWNAHTPLPPELVLAEEYNVSVGTIRRALDDLATHHLITRQRGKGTYVTRHSLDQALYRWFSIEPDDGSKAFPKDEVVKVEEGLATEEECHLLDLQTGGRVFRVHRLRELHGFPTIRDLIVVDSEKLPGFSWPSAKDPTPYAYYERAYQIKVIEVIERVKTDAADPEDAHLLGVTVGAPILTIQRLALTFDAEPVELRISRLSTARHAYVNRIT